jgi:alpha-galactosidase
MPREWTSRPKKFLTILLLALVVNGYGTTSTWPSQPPPATRRLAPPTARWRKAFVSSDEKAQTWTIGNSGILVTFGLTATKDFVLREIVNPQTGRVLNSRGAADTAVTINGTSVPLGVASSGWTLQSARASQDDRGVQLVFTFGSAIVPVTIERSYACYSESPTIETWTTFQATRADRPVTVSNPNAWQLAVPGDTVHYLSGLRGENADGDADGGFAIETSTLDSRGRLTLGAQGRSTEQFVPVIIADTSSDEFFGGLLWSGSWQISVQGFGGEILVSAGLPAMDIVVDVHHPLEAPHGFFGVTAGGSGNVSQALRGFIDQGLRQGRPFQPLVTYNTWFSYGTAVDEQSMRDEMLAAAGMGVELFVLDAGWYAGTDAAGENDFASGLGSFTADPERFPSGLTALTEYAHSLGLKFGLWVEPERTALAYVGQPGLAQEPWLAMANGSYDGGKPNRQTSPLICLGASAARAWLLDQLTTLLDQVQPDYLKWDNNFWINCTRAGHGHGPSDGNFAQVQGLYAVLSALRSRYPDMLIENVSGGGNRLDLGMLRYTDTGWMDDRSGPAAHVRHNLQGLTMVFPPAYLLSFVNNDAAEPLANPPDLQLYARSRMPGVLGLNYRVADLTTADRAGISQELSVYKTFRDTVRDASGMLLTDQARTTNGPAWDSLEEFVASSGQVVVFAYQNDPGVSRLTVVPTGLETGATYAVTTANGTSLGSATGADLTTNGIEINGSPVSAAHVLLLRPQVEGDAPETFTAGGQRRTLAHAP